MLAPERDLSRRGRIRVFVVWQLPTLLFASYVFVAVTALQPPGVMQAGFWAGSALIVGASLLAVAVPWERLGLQWRIVVPVIDVVGVALLRLDLFPTLPSVGLLSVLPIIWLAFDFDRFGIALAVVGACFVTGLMYLREQSLPSSGIAWVQASLLPLAAIGFAAVVQVIAGVLRRNRRQLLDQSHELARTLEIAQERLATGETIFETVDAALCFYRDGELALVNARARALAELGRFDLDRPPYVGEMVWDETRTTPVAPEDQVFPRALAGEVITGELQWVGPAGDQVAVIGSSDQVYRADGRHLGTIIAAWDVTDLMESLRLREDFLATVSHELRTPLTSVIGYQEILRETLDEALGGVFAEVAGDVLKVGNAGAGGTTDAADAAGGTGEAGVVRALSTSDLTTIRKALDVAQRSAYTLRERVTHLLSASKNAVDLQYEDIDVSLLATKALIPHRMTATNAGLDLIVHIEDDILGRIDPVRWEQALDNLVSNAIKYTPAGGSIAVSLASKPGRAPGAHRGEGSPEMNESRLGFDLVVSDTGIGMSPAEARQVFNRFFRGKAAHQGAIQGIGIGLSITRAIVEAHGGHIALSSNDGHDGTAAGTTMTMWTPARPSS